MVSFHTMMAEKGGFECEFVEKPPKAFQSECPVCLLVLREPFQVTCCGYAFCQACIEKVKQENKPCPCCNLDDFDKFEDKRLKRSLYEFKVYCTNKQQGCDWVGELGELDSHFNSNPVQQKLLVGCKFLQIKCQNCADLILRSSMQTHQRTECPKRQFRCNYCNKYESTYDDISLNHWSVCDYYTVPCSNNCGKTIERQNLKSHIANQCPLTTVDCNYKHVGCEEQVLRKDMPVHLTENVIQHGSLQAESLKQVISQLNQLKEENKQLKEQVAKLTKDLKLQQICTPICPVEFTMTIFEQKKVNDDVWFSPPFYTHPKGYKMSVIVAANGYDEFEGTHTAIGIRLMKGEFDDQLKWPFQGQITIQLLSQVDEKHESTRISFTDTESDYNAIASRVLTEEEEKDKLGPVTVDFISHSDLQPKYLKNNCLKVCAHQYKRL